MADFRFADRYAEAGFSPTAQIIAAREAPADRIVRAITNARILDLTGIYYGSPGLELAWLRDEFVVEDASFSLVNNEREARVLAATMLGALVAKGSDEAILAITVGSVAGHRHPEDSAWLLRDARTALLARSVAARQPTSVLPKVAHTVVPKLADEIAAVPVDDWPALLVMLDRIRNEAVSSAKTTSGQATNALAAVNLQVSRLREENQMMWWLLGGHSRTLQRSFGEFGPQQTAIVGASDLAALTTVSRLGPVAAPAMLERVIALSRRTEGTASRELASAVDGLHSDELKRLDLFVGAIPARLGPMTAAIDLARTIGAGAWHVVFKERTGLDASIALEPVDLAGQLYYEHLLGQLL